MGRKEINSSKESQIQYYENTPATDCNSKLIYWESLRYSLNEIFNLLRTQTIILACLYKLSWNSLFKNLLKNNDE